MLLMEAVCFPESAVVLGFKATYQHEEEVCVYVEGRI